MTARKRYWLMKSEPDAFSIDDLAKVKVEPWNGVRNYQARNFMRDGMQVGDGILFYHSNTKVPGIVGLATVASTAYPDDTQFDPKSDYHDPKSTRENPRWMLVDVAFDRKLKQVIALARRGLPAGCQGQSPVGVPGDRRAVEAAAVAGKEILIPCLRVLPMSEAKRLAAEKAIEYVKTA